jgi:hypothetical protein
VHLMVIIVDGPSVVKEMSGVELGFGPRGWARFGGGGCAVANFVHCKLKVT